MVEEDEAVDGPALREIQHHTDVAIAILEGVSVLGAEDSLVEAADHN